MLLIKNGYLCTNGLESVKQDLLIIDGKIAEIGDSIDVPPEARRRARPGLILDFPPEARRGMQPRLQVIDAEGLVIAPGLVDMHVHLRDPGLEYKEDIYTGAEAAVAGGVTTCLCMANTSPPIDKPEIVEYVINKAKTAPITILPCAAVTVGQSGKELTDFAALKAAGAAALSDDGNPIQNAALKRMALQKARENDMLIISHCEDADMVKNHGVNEGKISEKLGIPGRPAIAEEIMVARDVMLAMETGARVHIAHVSTAGSVGIIREAKKKGVLVTAETAPQYFSLTEDEVLKQNALARVNPPLRTKADVEAIIEGLQDGTIDVIATDHAPHSMDEKTLPLTEAMSGMIGLETSLALAMTYLYHTKRLGMGEIIKLMTENPAKILGIKAGKLEKGAAADLVIFDPNEKWTVDPSKFKSKARNTPYGEAELKGKVRHTVVNGDLALS